MTIRFALATLTAWGISHFKVAGFKIFLVHKLPVKFREVKGKLSAGKYGFLNSLKDEWNSLSWVDKNSAVDKGQLNSEWIYEVIGSSKIPTKNYRDFCRSAGGGGSEKGQNLISAYAY